MAKYKHIFFDLDHTLWDYERNATETLERIYSEFQLAQHSPNVELFCTEFFRVNDELWTLYRNNKIKREELNITRFAGAIPALKDNSKLIGQISNYFIEECPKKAHLVDGALELLDYLKTKHYHLYIVTNGHDKMQNEKIKSSGIGHFFTRVYTSEGIGAKKPHKKYFEYAIKSSNALKKESIVIGDNYEADILGAKNFGVDQIFYNPRKNQFPLKATFEVEKMSEISSIL